MEDSLSNGNRPLQRRPRLLLLAFTCTPGRGSEYAIGWNRVIQAGRFADAWVICEGRKCEEAIRRHISEKGPVPGIRFVFLSYTRFQVALAKIPGCYYLAYYLWHRRAYKVAQGLHAEHQFDLAHQVNFIGYREPGFLWRLPIPFVWGPVGGTQNFPWRFLSLYPIRQGAWEVVRNVLNLLQLRFAVRARKAARKASALLVANSTIERDMTRMCGVPVERMSDVGVSDIDESARTKTHLAGRLRILWSGLIEPRKALPLLLEAVARLPADIRWELRVLGDGPLFKYCRNLAEKLGINDHIKWLGWLPHWESMQQYSWADIFAFTSLRDTTGTVVLEALSRGVPVVALDHQGMTDVVTPDCGLKIAVTTPGQVIQDLAQALTELALDPHRRQRLDEGALRRAEHYLWSRQGERLASVYQRVLAAAGNDAQLRERVDAPVRNQSDMPEVLCDIKK